jgi:hypothetical protein
MVQIKEITGRSVSNESAGQKWSIIGVYTANEARAYTFGASAGIVPGPNGFLYRQDINVTEQGAGVWHGTVTYGPDPQESSTPGGSISFNFDTTGGSFHITHSKGTVNKYPSSAVSYNQAINVVKSGAELQVEGAEIVIPALRLSYTIRNPQGVVNESYARGLAGITGCINSSAFRGFAAGEVLFLGGVGSDGTNAEAEVTLHFACEKNLQGLIVGSLTGIAKAGHDLMWVMWADSVSSGKPTKIPLAAYIERVYTPIDLAAALGM